ncbi:hypothetical protein ACQJBY_061035 [Aegilops geniculata]
MAIQRYDLDLLKLGHTIVTEVASPSLLSSTSLPARFTRLRRRYGTVQDQEQGGVEAHKAHQEARVSNDYGSGAPGRSLPTAMVVLPTGSLRCRDECKCRLIERGRFCVLRPLRQQ